VCFMETLSVHTSIFLSDLDADCRHVILVSNLLCILSPHHIVKAESQMSRAEKQ
jgi:hypothetical protein